MVTKNFVTSPKSHRASTSEPKIKINIVYAFKNNPPFGVEPIEWLLLTTVPVNSFDDAIEKAHWYACRPLIETYHKVLKSGCKIEDQKIETAKNLEHYLAIDSVGACHGNNSAKPSDTRYSL